MPRDLYGAFNGNHRNLNINMRVKSHQVKYARYLIIYYNIADFYE